VAVTVTVCGEGTELGAVYRPALEIVPTVGFNDQVTAVFVAPVTPAVNCWVWEGAKEAVEGVSETATGGLRLTVALANLVESALLVAVTVTLRALAIEAGAV
jgi:hypothetical protein